MLPTLPFIEDRFDYFNRLCFQNSLPRPTFRLSNARTYLGQMAYRRKRGLLGQIIGKEALILSVSRRYDLPPAEIEDTIIHEMIHLYIHVHHVRDTSAHGPAFRRMMDDINRRFSRHITIARRNDAALLQSDRSNDRYILCVSRLRDGRIGITRTSARGMVKLWNAIPALPNVERAEWFISKDAYFSRLPRSRTATVYLLPRDHLYQHLLSARRILRRPDGFYIQKEEIRPPSPSTDFTDSPNF